MGDKNEREGWWISLGPTHLFLSAPSLQDQDLDPLMDKLKLAQNLIAHDPTWQKVESG